MRVVFYADSCVCKFVGEDIEHVITHKVIEGGCKECLAIAVATTVEERFVRIAYILLSTSKFFALVIKNILDVRLLYEIKDKLQFVKLVDTFL